MRLVLLSLTVWIIVVPAVSRAGPPEDESESLNRTGNVGERMT